MGRLREQEETEQEEAKVPQPRRGGPEGLSSTATQQSKALQPEVVEERDPKVRGYFYQEYIGGLMLFAGMAGKFHPWMMPHVAVLILLWIGVPLMLWGICHEESGILK